MIQAINISLIPSDNKPVINVSQFDNGLRVLRFFIFDDVEMEVPHEFDGETVTCNIRKNDNNIVVITGTLETETTEETETSYVQVVLTEQACACVGSNYGEISLSDNDDVIGTCNFKLIVERSPLAGGITSQSEIDNLTTQIEEITEQVIGEGYYTKEEVNGLIDEVEESIPTKTSELTNDSGFITASDIPTIPTKTSQLTNDSGFITASDIPTIPTKTSQLTNDSGFITVSDIPTIPTKTSQLNNDSGFTTIDDAATVSDKTWSSEKISDELYALLPVGTASGSVASFNTALAKPLVSCIVNENATKLYQLSKYGTQFYGLLIGNFLFVELSSMLWNYNESSQAFVSVSINNLVKKPASTSVMPYFISSKYTVIKRSDLVFGTSDKVITQQTSGSVIVSDLLYTNTEQFTNSLQGEYLVYELETPTTPTITPTEFETLFNAFDVTRNIYDLPLQSMPVAYVGDNNFFTDYGDISVQYMDTIQNYIDTRVNTVSNRSLSMLRTLETLEKSTTLERGETDEQK